MRPGSARPPPIDFLAFGGFWGLSRLATAFAVAVRSDRADGMEDRIYEEDDVTH